jgi:organic radical activating enzyme
MRLIEFYDKMGMKEDYIRDGKLNLKTIDIQVTEKCSLKCKDCNNLMQYYVKPKDVDMDVLFKSIDKFMQCIDNLDEFRVLGGDPFMHKELYKVINKLVAYDKCKRVVVYTNAKIVPKGENLICLKNKKVVLDITNYGESSSAHLKLVELAKKENIAFTTIKCTDWSDSGRMLPFSGKSEKELENLFTNCCQSELISLLHGKLYRCPFSANGINLKAIPQNDSDEVNLINDNFSINELREQIKKLCFNKKYLTACSYCNGKDFSTLKILSAIQTKKPLPYTINKK